MSSTNEVIESSSSNSFASDSDSNAHQTNLIPEEIQNARTEWNNLEQQQIDLDKNIQKQKGVGGTIIDRGSSITFFDARAFLIEQCHTKNELKSLNVPEYCIDTTSCCCMKPKINHEAIQTWEIIYKISKMTFDETDLLHHRILNTLLMLMTGRSTPPARKGPHWQTIGFQSDDPITDLRATGMMGLLLPLNLFSRFKSLSKFLIETSKLPEQDFPIMVVLISYTKESIDMAGTSNLLESGTNFEECWDQMALYFAGMVFTLCMEWRNEMLDFTHDFHRFNQIANRAKLNPSSMVEAGKKALTFDHKTAFEQVQLEKIEDEVAISN